MPLFPTTIAGSLPKPFWLAEPNRLWAPWRFEGADLSRAKRDATLIVLKLQEDAGIDIVSDGEQSRQHFVHGFLEFVEGIDFRQKVAMGIRNNRYTAMVPRVVGPLRLKGRVHAEEARVARAHTSRKLKITMPGPMTIVDTIADEFYGDRMAMAIYMDDVKDWGIEALHRAIEGLACTTAVHICYGYGIKANLDWKATLGSEWRQYEEIFPALAASRIKQISIEAKNSRVPMDLIGLLEGKDVLVGVIDVASDSVETPEEVAATIEAATKFVPAERIFPCTNCGMAPMQWDIAFAKLGALGEGARLARRRFA